MATLIQIGADIGQRVDPTAIAVVQFEERVTETRTKTAEHFTARALIKVPLNTPYPDIAERIKEVCVAVRAYSPDRPKLYIDATGVGTPLVDALKRAEVPAKIVACFFNHGDKRTYENGEVKIGKAWLVGQLQVLLQSGRLHLPKTAEAEALAQELLDYEIKIDQDGTDKYGAFKVGKHDDLVTALGLAVQPVKIWRVWSF